MMLLTVSLNLSAQRTQQFGKFTDQNGNTIKGTSMERGYERQLIIDEFSVVNGSLVTIRIPNSAAANAFQSIVNSKFALQSGDISILKMEADRKFISQKIQVTNIKVLSVTIKDEGVTIELQPEIFDQMYYETDKSGKVIEVRN